MIRATRLNIRHYALLMVVALLVALPGRMRIPPIDRDESRYLQATSQMLETGNLVDVRFQDQPRYLQPAGIYWLEAAAVKLTGMQGQRVAWPYRIPSLLSAVAAVLLTAWIGQALFGAGAGMGAGLLLACSVLLGWEAHNAKIDATLLATTLAAQATLLRLLLDREESAPDRPGVAALYWLILGAGLMLKGPVVLLVSWGSLVALAITERRVGWWRRLHPAWGIPLMLLVVLPWCIAIGVVSGGDFFRRSVGHNFLGKVASGQEAHGAPPGYHLALFTFTFWPGSLLAVRAIPFVWGARRSLAVRFLLCWIVPTWLVFEAIATKLPHYVLPTFPAIACLAAAGVAGTVRSYGGRVVMGLYLGLWLVVSAALAAAGPVLLWQLQGGPPQAIAVSAVLGACAFVLASACPVLLPRQPNHGLAAAVAGAVLMAGSIYGIVLPELRSIWLSPRIADAVAAVRPCPNSVLSSSSYSEPSLVFLSGRNTRLVGPRIAAADLGRDPVCALALIGQKDTEPFLNAAEGAGVQPHALATIDGINYSTGKRLALTLYGASTANRSQGVP